MADMLGMLLHGLNVVLLIALLYIYLQNCRKLKTKLTAGLVLFAGLFLLQSLMNIYYDTAMVMYSSAPAETAATIVEAVKAAGFAVLLWVSWD